MLPLEHAANQYFQLGDGLRREPFAVDVLIIDEPPCGAAQSETFLFPDFRSENREGSFKDATVSVTGRCNAVEPEVTRGS